MPRRAKRNERTIPHKTYPYAYLKDRNGIYYAVVHDRRVSTFIIADGSKENVNAAMKKLDACIAAYMEAKRLPSFAPITEEPEDDNTVMYLVEQYMLNKKGHVSTKTLKNYMGAIHHLDLAMPLSYPVLKKYFGELRRDMQSKMKKSTLLTRFLFYDTLFDYAVTLDLIEKNPVKPYTDIVVPKSDIRLITDTELDAILEGCAKRDDELWRYVKLLSLTGMRANEALSLTVRDITSDHIIVDGKRVHYQQKKIRYIIYDALPGLKEHAMHCLEHAARDGRLFASEYARLRYNFQIVVEHLQIDATHFHDLRRYAKHHWEIVLKLPPHLCNLLAGHGFNVRSSYHREATADDLRAYLK